MRVTSPDIATADKLFATPSHRGGKQHQLLFLLLPTLTTITVGLWNLRFCKATI